VVAVTVVTAKKAMDIQDVARQINDWFLERNFETHTDQAEYGLLIKARKSSALRSIAAADRALVARISNDSGSTEVVIRQGSWVANLTSNTAWNAALIALTGGGALVITGSVSGWSFVVQHKLVVYVRKILGVTEAADQEPAGDKLGDEGVNL
jgi:hypothetical protein